MRQFIIFLLVFYCATSELTAQSSFEDFYIQKAEEQMSNGQFDAALENYEILVTKYPQNPKYQFQQALCYHRLQNYPKVISIVEPLVTKYPKEVSYYRLLGNAQDLGGNYAQAVAVFHQGMEELPYDAEFNHDLGVIEMLRGDYDKAVEYWEGGIRREPYFASNYYWLCRTFAEAGEPVLALIYGEYFMVLELSSDRFNETSMRLYNLYHSIIKDEPLPTSIHLQPRKPNRLKNAFLRTFDVLRQNGLLNLERVSKNSNKEVNDLAAIGLIRGDFIELWMKLYDEKMSVQLFDWHHELNKQGKFHYYNYWIFVQGDPEYFNQWLGLYQREYEGFINWFILNRPTIDILHYFDNRKFEE